MINAPATFGLILTVAYLLGAIPFALIITRLKGVDLTKVGSGNYGATNVYRALGLSYALIVFFLDAFKGAIPVLIAMHYFPLADVVHILIGFTAIFGHSFSLFLGFRGGKGVATAAGVFAILTPVAFGLTFVVAVALILITKIVSVGTLAGCILLPFLMVYFGAAKLLIYLVSFISFFIVIKHRGNISRLIQGKENKIK